MYDNYPAVKKSVNFIGNCYLFSGSKMFALIAIIVFAINTPSVLGWDSDQMEVFDLVEEMNNINFYQFLDVPEVSIMIYNYIFYILCYLNVFTLLELLACSV